MATGTGKFGWCLTGHHKTCIKVINNVTECTCECHKKEK